MKSNLKEGSYFAVDAYETIKSRSQYYIGRVLSLSKKNIKMKFMTKSLQVPNQYDWPTKDDILDDIDVAGIFVGPIDLKGTCPYIIMGGDEAYELYKKHR